VQLTTLLATAVAFMLAVGIPRALGDGAMWFVVPYVAVRVIGLLLYYWVARSDPDQLTAVRVFSLLSGAGLLSVFVGAVLGGTAQYAAWALAIVLDLVAAGIGGQREGWNLHPDHFVERHGLIVIIALGETLIVAASGLVDAPATAPALVTAVLAVAVTSALWWGYFRHARPLFEHALAAHHGSSRSMMARDVFSVIHFPMLCGIIGMAAATEQALAHPDAPLAADVRAALGVGALLFIGGTALAMWRASGRLPLWRVLLSFVAAVAVYAAGFQPSVAMAILLVLLAIIAVIEHRDANPH
jgi:low temperature requirement protein LtrA